MEPISDWNPVKFMHHRIVCPLSTLTCSGRAGKVGALSADRPSFDIYVQKRLTLLYYLAMYVD